MSIIRVAGTTAELPGAGANSTDATGRDSAYSPSNIKFNVQSSGDAFPCSMKHVQPAGDYWLHFRWYGTYAYNDVGSDGGIFSLYDGSGIRIVQFDFLDGNGRIIVYGDTTVTGPNFSFGQFQVHTYDVKVEVGANITVTLWVNEGLVCTVTAANSAGRTQVARTTFDMDDLTGGSSSAHFYINEIIVTDGEDTRGWRLSMLVPTSQGTYNEWDLGYAVLADLSEDSRMAAAAAGLRTSWNPTAYGGAGGSAAIRAVIASTLAIKGNSGPSKVSNFLRIGGVNYDGAAITPGAGGADLICQTVWDQKPGAGVDWTPADLAALEVGILSVA